MLATALVVIALVLALVDAFTRHADHGSRATWLLHLAVALVCIALLIGVEPLLSIRG